MCWTAEGVAKTCTVVGFPSRDAMLPGCPSWVYLNAGGTGYYRTVWNGDQIAALPLDRLSPAERLTLVFDLRAQKSARGEVRAELTKLASDPEPAIVRAAQAGLETEKGAAAR